jgi:hypothetical protein
MTIKSDKRDVRAEVGTPYYETRILTTQTPILAECGMCGHTEKEWGFASYKLLKIY